jgi:chromosome segregation ATPase
MVDKFITDRIAELDFIQGSTGTLLKDAKRFIQSIGEEAKALRAEVKSLTALAEKLEKSEAYYIERAKEAEKEVKKLKAKLKAKKWKSQGLNNKKEG